MAVGTIYAAIRAVAAAAMGIYSFDRHSGAKEFRGGIWSSIRSKLAKKPNQKLEVSGMDLGD